MDEALLASSSAVTLRALCRLVLGLRPLQLRTWLLLAVAHEPLHDFYVMLLQGLLIQLVIGIGLSGPEVARQVLGFVETVDHVYELAEYADGLLHVLSDEATHLRGKVFFERVDVVEGELKDLHVAHALHGEDAVGEQLLVSQPLDCI